MPTLEERVQRIEDKQAIEGLIQSYYAAVDTLSDIDGLLDCFTPDAVVDFEKLGLQVFRGHEEIRGFFLGVFAETDHHAHHVSNIRVLSLESDEATARGYVIGRAEGANGVNVFVHCFYDIECVRTPAGWKMRRFDEGAVMPIGSEVTELHAHSQMAE